MIHNKTEWGAEVVYGDTDSLFVSLPGRTKDDAFSIGEDIAKTITNMNPNPIKLKFEKVCCQHAKPNADISFRFTIHVYFSRRNVMSGLNMKRGQMKYPYSMQKG